VGEDDQDEEHAHARGRDRQELDGDEVPDMVGKPAQCRECLGAARSFDLVDKSDRPVAAPH
jgi:hypothetical protein